MTARFLFDGGNYKRGIDDSRLRVPLTTDEAAMVHHDPEMPGAVAPSSISTEFNMQKWSQYLCNLQAGDELFIGLLPDAAFYRALWMMSHDALPGFTVTAELVSVRDVYDAYLAGDATGVAAWSPTSLTYDFADGLGTATKDALQQVAIYGGTVDEYRNEDALVVEPLATPKAALLGESLYIRLTIDTVAPDDSDESGCCTSCGINNMPTFQVGALYDILCADKQRVRKFCNCPEDLCKEPCPEPNDPPVTVVLTEEESPQELELTFSEEVQDGPAVGDGLLIFSPDDVIIDQWDFNAAPNTFGATIIFGPSLNPGDEVEVYVPANVVSSTTTGVLNNVSNVLLLTVPGG